MSKNLAAKGIIACGSLTAGLGVMELAQYDDHSTDDAILEIMGTTYDIDEPLNIAGGVAAITLGSGIAIVGIAMHGANNRRDRV